MPTIEAMCTVDMHLLDDQGIALWTCLLPHIEEKDLDAWARVTAHEKDFTPRYRPWTTVDQRLDKTGRVPVPLPDNTALRFELFDENGTVLLTRTAERDRMLKVADWPAFRTANMQKRRETDPAAVPPDYSGLFFATAFNKELRLATDAKESKTRTRLVEGLRATFWGGARRKVPEGSIEFEAARDADYIVRLRPFEERTPFKGWFTNVHSLCGLMIRLGAPADLATAAAVKRARWVLRQPEGDQEIVLTGEQTATLAKFLEAVSSSPIPRRPLAFIPNTADGKSNVIGDRVVYASPRGSRALRGGTETHSFWTLPAPAEGVPALPVERIKIVCKPGAGQDAEARGSFLFRPATRVVLTIAPFRRAPQAGKSVVAITCTGMTAEDFRGHLDKGNVRVTDRDGALRSMVLGAGAEGDLFEIGTFTLTGAAGEAGPAWLWFTEHPELRQLNADVLLGVPLELTALKPPPEEVTNGKPRMREWQWTAPGPGAAPSMLVRVEKPGGPVLPDDAEMLVWRVNDVQWTLGQSVRSLELCLGVGYTEAAIAAAANPVAEHAEHDDVNFNRLNVVHERPNRKRWWLNPESQVCPTMFDEVTHRHFFECRLNPDEEELLALDEMGKAPPTPSDPETIREAAIVAWLRSGSGHRVHLFLEHTYGATRRLSPEPGVPIGGAIDVPVVLPSAILERVPASAAKSASAPALPSVSPDLTERRKAFLSASGAWNAAGRFLVTLAFDPMFLSARGWPLDVKDVKNVNERDTRKRKLAAAWSAVAELAKARQIELVVRAYSYDWMRPPKEHDARLMLSEVGQARRTNITASLQPWALEALASPAAETKPHSLSIAIDTEPGFKDADVFACDVVVHRGQELVPSGPLVPMVASDRDGREETFGLNRTEKSELNGQAQSFLRSLTFAVGRIDTPSNRQEEERDIQAFFTLPAPESSIGPESSVGLMEVDPRRGAPRLDVACVPVSFTNIAVQASLGPKTDQAVRALLTGLDRALNGDAPWQRLWKREDWRTHFDQLEKEEVAKSIDHLVTAMRALAACVPAASMLPSKLAALTTRYRLFSSSSSPSSAEWPDVVNSALTAMLTAQPAMFSDSKAVLLYILRTQDDLPARNLLNVVVSKRVGRVRPDSEKDVDHMPLTHTMAGDQAAFALDWCDDVRYGNRFRFEDVRVERAIDRARSKEAFPIGGELMLPLNKEGAKPGAADTLLVRLPSRTSFVPPVHVVSGIWAGLEDQQLVTEIASKKIALSLNELLKGQIKTAEKSDVRLTHLHKTSGLDRGVVAKKVDVRLTTSAFWIVLDEEDETLGENDTFEVYVGDDALGAKTLMKAKAEEKKALETNTSEPSNIALDLAGELMKGHGTLPAQMSGTLLTEKAIQAIAGLLKPGAGELAFDFEGVNATKTTYRIFRSGGAWQIRADGNRPPDQELWLFQPPGDQRRLLLLISALRQVWVSTRIGLVHTRNKTWGFDKNFVRAGGVTGTRIEAPKVFREITAATFTHPRTSVTPRACVERLLVENAAVLTKAAKGQRGLWEMLALNISVAHRQTIRLSSVNRTTRAIDVEVDDFGSVPLRSWRIEPTVKAWTTPLAALLPEPYRDFDLMFQWYSRDNRPIVRIKLPVGAM